LSIFQHHSGQESEELSRSYLQIDAIDGGQVAEFPGQLFASG